ncbi:MAG: ATP-binding cassette domain-containing protein [Lachnospiraceae bacterium]|nr:ATP-binding cassette domain-containing protein [Lachnospiraceae bacterium]
MEIKIEGLWKEIKHNVVLKDINLTLEGGRIYGIQGKNGCGKTMLMRSIAGLILPSKGKITINGKVLHKDISIPESIGVLIENPSFMNTYSGYENLRMLARLQKNVSESDIHELIKKVGLEENSRKKFGKYSLGMKQRLGIAAAIMGNPEIILLDEPINAIDGDGVEQITQLILGLKSKDRVILVACHDQAEMQLLADEIITMREGEFVERRGVNADATI